MSRTYNADLLKIMTLFESVTRTSIKDCFIDDNSLLTFVVDTAYIGKAIGKHASNVKRLEELLKRKIKIIAYSPAVAEFVSNLIYPAVADVEVEGNTVIVKAKDMRDKAFLIGRNQSTIKNNLNIVKKYFKDVEHIKVM
jgi:N utilization substance protein A